MNTDPAPPFAPHVLQRPATRGLDVVTKLRHFALITYAVPPERVRPLVHPRFDLDTSPGPDGQPALWVSVVPFEDADFHFARLPQANFRFGQTNYRTYVIDRVTGQAAVWFFGTTLGGWPVVIPRYLWRLPWHRGRIRFETHYDAQQKRYTRYRMTTASPWAAATLELEDSGAPVASLDGFSDLEAGWFKLTHPLVGAYFRRDGRLGSYSVWHDRLQCTVGRIRQARFALLDRLGLVPFEAQSSAHSVLIQPETEFIVKLPPRPL
ncbi:MAG: DUF2071 domain-containing protein [Anaerolineae bacterium]|nr:DUF2071 domain-containing protein [Anaerolineae bacterium]